MEQINTETNIEDDRTDDGQVESDETHSQCEEEYKVSLFSYLWDEINRGEVTAPNGINSYNEIPIQLTDRSNFLL